MTTDAEDIGITAYKGPPIPRTAWKKRKIN